MITITGWVALIAVLLVVLLVGIVLLARPPARRVDEHRSDG